MREKSIAFESIGNKIYPKRLLVVLTIISTIGMGIWTWIQHNRELLPPPDSKPGKALLRQYQGLTHDIWLILLLIAVGYLIYKSYIYRQQEAHTTKRTTQGAAESCLQFIRNNPIATALFAIYTVAMISGTTYLYKDMVGWYPDLVEGFFLNNFSLRGSLVAETMRRTDYRFFPLAHQDIHILSWFTIHIKTWMLFSAAELIGIALLSVKFLNSLEEKPKAKASTVLLITALLLIHPSTGTAFFHVIYCERLLCLVFMLFINAYLRHLQSQSRSSFHESLLWALIGIFIKDISILLFVVPPASIWAADAIRLQSQRLNQRPELTPPIRPSHHLEYWLCSYLLLFITSYIVLALIPSSYSTEAAYNSVARHNITLDLRFYLFTLITATRVAAIANGRMQFCLLDALNISAMGYVLALAAAYEFESDSYLALPFQLIATINIAWAWIQLIEKRQHGHGETKTVIYAAFAASALIGADHLTSQNTFTSEIRAQKFEQSYIQSTYEKLDQVTRKIRESGEDVNIIINKKSRLSAKRHLNRIPYRSLIEYVPAEGQYIVKDGAGKGALYTPKIGDIIANLDKSIDLISPILANYNTELLYRHNKSKKTGIILRVTSATSVKP
jgi:hypothetical protein